MNVAINQIAVSRNSVPNVPVRPQATLPPLPQDTVVLGSVESRPENDLRLLAKGKAQNTWTSTPQGLLVEKNKPDATLVVLDQFYSNETTEGRRIPAHGAIDVALMRQSSGTGESNIGRIENTLVPSKPQQFSAESKKGEPPFGARLDRFITQKYNYSNQAIELGLKETPRSFPKAKTISVSEGTDANDLVKTLADIGSLDPKMGDALRNELRLPAGASFYSPESAVALAQRVQGALKKDPTTQLCRGSSKGSRRAA